MGPSTKERGHFRPRGRFQDAGFTRRQTVLTSPDPVLVSQPDQLFYVLRL